jgi:hypothetical protein
MSDKPRLGRHSACCMILAGLLSGFGTTTGWALEMHPPWVHDTPKPSSPYHPPWIKCGKDVDDDAPDHPPWVGREKCKEKAPYHPPWIGSECSQQEGIRGGYWAVPLDWRDVDWSQADSGAGLHQRTQALSLWLEAKFKPNQPRPDRDPILEYHADPLGTGPGRITK